MVQYTLKKTENFLEKGYLYLAVRQTFIRCLLVLIFLISVIVFFCFVSLLEDLANILFRKIKKRCQKKWNIRGVNHAIMNCLLHFFIDADNKSPK